MKPSTACPAALPASGEYYCHILQTVRQSSEEQICGICEMLFNTMTHNLCVQHAFAFAAEAHQGQYRKGTQIPYLIHLIRTWGYVQQMTSDEEEQAAALLHDVLEDTEVTAYTLRDQFGTRILDLVAGESEYKREQIPAGETWQLRKLETIERLRSRMGKAEEHSAMHIAFGDKLANLYSMWYEYRLIGDLLWDKFNQKDKSKHGWYYGEMGKLFADYFTENIEKKLVEEYKKYYREVFQNEI